MMVLQHITLETGHVSMSPRSMVRDATMELLTADPTWPQGGMVLPGGWTALMLASPLPGVRRVLGPGRYVYELVYWGWPIVTCYLASRPAPGLWREATRSAGVALHEPTHTPWLAEHIHFSTSAEELPLDPAGVIPAIQASNHDEVMKLAGRARIDAFDRAMEQVGDVARCTAFALIELEGRRE